jgi:DNA-binding response OmpR family regulator
MSALRILMVEDETRLADAVKKGLGEEGFTVETAESAEDAEPIIARGALDLIVLDLQLPGKNGIDLLRELRAGGNQTPVLILTAHGSLEERVAGLDVGADDYLTKPFDLPELEARARALIRRGQSGGSSLLTHGPLTLDTSGRRATLAGVALELSARELGVLEVLMLRSGRVVNKDQLAEQLYSWDDEVGSNAIEVYVHRLRKKLEPAGVAIRTIRGLGYLLEKDA